MLNFMLQFLAKGLRWACYLTTAITLAPDCAKATDDDVVANVFQPVFRASCVQCHGEQGNLSGKINLAGIHGSADLRADLELLVKLVEALDSGFMPPPGATRLAGEQRQRLVVALRQLLHGAVRARGTPPHTPIRRMNRFQYSNAVQDLLDLQVDVFALPERMLRDHGYFRPASGRMPDELKAGSRPLGKSQLIDKRLAGVAPFPQDLRAEHGFDNRGDHLTLSPLLLESFLGLGRSILASADFNRDTSGAWGHLFALPPGAVASAALARATLRDFLTHAFRRPVDEAVLKRYADHVAARLESGQSYADSMKTAISAALASPRFLYLYERAGSGEAARQLDDFELAARLSFFLWGSIPDRTLLELAAADRLHDPAVLREQVGRMLKDSRLKRFCDSFPAQWLQLERIVASVPDRDRYPDFYFAKFRASMHMMLEPLLLFETILIENRSILELIDSDFSYRSELLERWYQDGTRPARVPSTAVPFRRVPITDRRQGGVITTAAVMTMTSSPLRTQPITRGAWLAGVIFNDPPAPAPAGVPPLPEEDIAGPNVRLTLRERFAQHRSNPACAVCHAKLDPLGFALENYGPTGVWRDTYANGREVDAAGVLSARHEFDGVVEFKDAILAERDRFARAFAEHLLAFALGRAVDPSDEPALDRIVQATAADGFRIQRLILQIVLSEPFQRKYSPAKPDRVAL